MSCICHKAALTRQEVHISSCDLRDCGVGLCGLHPSVVAGCGTGAGYIQLARDATFNERLFPVSIDAYEMVIPQKPLPGVLLVGINKNMSLGTRGNGPEIQPSPKLENTIDINIDGRIQM